MAGSPQTLRPCGSGYFTRTFKLVGGSTFTWFVSMLDSNAQVVQEHLDLGGVPIWEPIPSASTATGCVVAWAQGANDSWDIYGSICLGRARRRGGEWGGWETNTGGLGDSTPSDAAPQRPLEQWLSVELAVVRPVRRGALALPRAPQVRAAGVEGDAGEDALRRRAEHPSTPRCPPRSCCSRLRAGDGRVEQRGRSSDEDCASVCRLNLRKSLTCSRIAVVRLSMGCHSGAPHASHSPSLRRSASSTDEPLGMYVFTAFGPAAAERSMSLDDARISAIESNLGDSGPCDE